MLLGALLALSFCLQTEPPAEFYVSPAGNDANPGTREAPFATIARARDAVRPIAGMRPVTVFLRGGTYALSEPLVFRPEDSGKPGAPVRYSAFPGEKPVVSGGRTIRGWKAAPGGLWTAEVPGELRFNQLWIGDGRRIRARTPNAGEFFRVDGEISLGKPAQFRARGNDFLPQWAERGGVEVIALQSWAELRMPVVSARIATVPGVR